MRISILLLLVLFTSGCSSPSKVVVDDDELVSCIDDDVYRGNRNEHFEVLCKPYGRRLVWYSSGDSSYAIAQLKNNWDEYWPTLRTTYENMFEDWDDSERGSIEMLGGKWEFQIDAEAANSISFTLKFVVNGEGIAPNWDVFMDDGTVTHSQPAF